MVQETLDLESAFTRLKWKPLNEIPQSIDDGLSKQFLTLSLKDRNAIDEEIHGVSTFSPEETPWFLAASLEELSSELNEIPNDSKTAYIESQILLDTYVNTADFRLRFLRCELFDAKKAAMRLVNFLDYASALFGPEVLQRPMRMTDFTKNEQQYLMGGEMQTLPYRDRSGRSITVWAGNLTDKAKEVNARSRSKIMLYLQYALSDDLENQQKGVVKIAFMSKNSLSIIPSYQEYRESKMRHKATPLRMVTQHWCVPDQELFFQTKVLRTGHTLAGGNKTRASRTKFHIGDHMELLYQLKTYGIPVEWIPVTDSGKIKTKNHKQWIRTRNRLEEFRAANGNNYSAPPSSIIECPRSTDVIFRVGTSLACHPGNSMLQNSIESKLKDHSAGSQLEKEAITRDIIDDVRHRGGRFLHWVKDGWWTEMEKSKIHAKVAFQIRKNTGKRVAEKQAFQSSTFVFSNQDNDKRRKLSSNGKGSNRSEGSTDGCCNC